jgi:G3E family GTPase
MKTTVVCGLLGSGKTTFIRNFVRDRTEKTVVLVNDFGAAGIDGEIFSAGGIESVELPSGCVCCTLKFDLITTIGKIVKEFAPEHLVIEPSGVASPSGVLEALESAHVGPASVVCIIDATEFTELYESGMYGSFFEDQIMNADVVLVNKTDLAEEEKVIDVVRRIEAVNPRAVMFRTVNAAISVPLITAPPLPPGARRLARQQETGSLRARHGHDCFPFDSISIKVKQGAPFAVVKAIFDDLARGDFGFVARAKALVQTDRGPCRFDLVYGKVDTAPFEKAINESRTVIIGEGLIEDGIRQAFQDITSKPA